MQLLSVSQREWEEAEKMMQEQLQKGVTSSFKLRRKDNDDLIHSFICLRTDEGPKLYAMARDKFEDEGYLGEGARKKVKVLESKDGDVKALTIEPELELDQTRDVEMAVMARKGHIFGTFTKKLEERVEFIDGEMTREKIYTVVEYHPGVDMHEGYMEEQELIQGKLNEKQSLLAAVKIAQEIKDHHDNREIHRDIKEPNIILDQDPDNPDLISATLIDYETVVILPEGHEVLEVGKVGSADYTAPEAEGAIYSFESDVYAFGMICQHLNIDTGKMLSENREDRPTIDEAILQLKEKLMQHCENEKEMDHLISSKPNTPGYRAKGIDREVKSESEEMEREKPHGTGWGATPQVRQPPSGWGGSKPSTSRSAGDAAAPSQRGFTGFGSRGATPTAPGASADSPPQRHTFLSGRGATGSSEPAGEKRRGGEKRKDMSSAPDITESAPKRKRPL